MIALLFCLLLLLIVFLIIAMPFHFVRSSTRHPRSMSRQAYRDDRTRFHHELDTRGIRLSRGSGRRFFDWLWTKQLTTL